ncbi:MAG: ACP S-malonyltransferase [Gammaproteobacteria bacterium WSBS_2016_MAG_OTU1]
MKTAIVFPGQGSQSPEMVMRYAAHPQVAQTIDEVAAILDEDVQAIIADSTALGQTKNTQPLLLAVCVGVFRAAQLPSPVVMAGHSLGEYTALVCAEAIDFADAVRLVRRRGELMQQAASGSMAAVLGVSAEVVEDCCKTVRTDGGYVWAANYNSPQQIVIAGTAKSVEECGEVLKTKGAKKVVPLPVSIPSHCPLMQAAADNFAEALANITWKNPTTPIIHNTTLRTAEAADINTALTQQLICPVRWTETINAFAADGIEKIYECGPGGVLSGLGRRINRDLTHVSLANDDDLGAL